MQEHRLLNEGDIGTAKHRLKAAASIIEGSCSSASQAGPLSGKAIAYAVQVWHPVRCEVRNMSSWAYIQPRLECMLMSPVRHSLVHCYVIASERRLPSLMYCLYQAALQNREAAACTQRQGSLLRKHPRSYYFQFTRMASNLQSVLFS